MNAHDNWERSTKITLANGQEVRVRALPPLLLLRALEQVTLPKPPVIEIPSELPGAGVTHFENREDPEYLKQLREANLARVNISNELGWLYGLPDIVPPSDASWKEEIEFAMPSITWREGKRGYHLDYIEYMVFSSNEDMKKITDALNDLASIDVSPELLEAVEASFRGDLPRPGAEQASSS